MPGVCRTGDIGIGRCPNHDTPQDYITVFTSIIEDVTANGLGVATIGTVGISDCGHPTIATSGSFNATADGLGIHRVGDVGANYGPYIAVSGSTDVTSE